MSLESLIPSFLAHIERHSEYLAFNSILFDVYEGELKKYVEADLRQQLSGQSFEQARHRIAPVNLTKKIVDKLSKIYQQSPARNVQDGTDKDQELLTWYEDRLKFDRKMNGANEFYNLFGATLIQPYAHQGIPKLRAVPNDRFLPFSIDDVDDTIPTHLIFMHGTKSYRTKKANGEYTTREQYEDLPVYHVWSDTEFIVINSRGDIDSEEMARLGNPEGINLLGALPAIYINRSETLLIPKADIDGFTMTKLVPILLSDLNFAVMFQTFSIIYGINLDEENLKLAPNVFWRFKSDNKTEGKAEVGTIKPEVDINDVLGLIQSEFVLYLNTRGIKAGAVGNLTTENLASGVAKLLDEMDTSESRQEQSTVFQDSEQELWDLVLNRYNPYWIKAGLISSTQQFTSSASVLTNFAEQVPLTRRGDVVKDQESEVKAGFTTRRRAIKRLNPKMTEAEIDELMEEIDEEQAITVPAEDITQEGEETAT